MLVAPEGEKAEREAGMARAGMEGGDMKTVIAAIVASAVLVLPCHATGQVEQAIVGAWEWYSTGCDYGEVVMTPESEGYTRQDVFGPQEEGALYRRFRDGVLVEQGTYLVSHPVNPISGLVVDVIDIAVEGTTNRYGFLRVQEEPRLLGMSDGGCDLLWTARGPVPTTPSTWGAVKAQYW